MQDINFSKRAMLTNSLAVGGGLVAAATLAQSANAQANQNNIFHVKLEDFGGVGDGVTNCWPALEAAIASMEVASRKANIQRAMGTGSEMIDVYPTGVIEFGRGVYKIAPNKLHIQFHAGLKFVGQGSRGPTNTIYGATTLLISGPSYEQEIGIGFGIKLNGNGSRNFQIEDMDVCYDSNSFVGDLIHNYDSPGFKANRCYFGTYQLKAEDRHTSANSLLRQTYDEFTSITNCVFNGAKVGWLDDTETIVGDNTFGGSLSYWENVVFYDFVDAMMQSGPQKTRETMTIVNCAWNPISQHCACCVDLNNIVNLHISGFATPSHVERFVPTSEWVKLTNCSGQMSIEFGEGAKAATVSGNLTLSGNLFGGKDGITLKSGIIKAFGNKFIGDKNRLAIGYTIAPDNPLSIELGADSFSSNVTTSYYLAEDSADIRGVIRYSPEYDNSDSRFEINSNRVRVVAVDESMVTSPAALVTIPFYHSGRTYVATGTGDQHFTLPEPGHCVEIAVSKFSAAGNQLKVSAPSGKNFMVGKPGTRISGYTTDVGAYIKFQAVNANTYIATSIVGNWTFS